MSVDRFDLDLGPELSQRLERHGNEFLADFLGVQVERQPDHVPALIDLGHVLTQLGRFDEGLAVDQRLASLLPTEPTVHYNLACSLALTGERDAALGALARSIELGYDDVAFLREDEDLAALRDDPRFQALIERAGDASD